VTNRSKEYCIGPWLGFFDERVPVLVEGGLALVAAEVIRLTVEHLSRPGLFRVDAHVTHGVFNHPHHLIEVYVFAVKSLTCGWGVV